MPTRSSVLAILQAIAFAILPIVSLLSHNINEVPIRHAVRPAVLAAGSAVVLLALLRRLLRDWEQAGLIASILLIFFFSYGHVYGGLLHGATSELFRAARLVGRHETLGPAWLFLSAIAVYAILRLRRQRAMLIRIFALMASIAWLVPTIEIVSHEVQLSRQLRSHLLEPELDPLPKTAEHPDIYYVVLDGYARADVLQDIYKYDNSDLLGFLQNKGFYVASESRSNYTQTSLSLASSLNMSYLDSLATSLGPDSDDRTPLSRLIRWSAVGRALDDLGYSIIGLPTGYRVSELENADRFIRAPIGAATTLERLAFETSGLILLQELATNAGAPRAFPGYRAHRERIEFVVEQLGVTARLPGPKFVFVHFLIPHPPFVFGADGSAVEQRYPFTLMDGDAFLGTDQEYLRGYRDQTIFVDRLLQESLGEILSISANPPIILLQADHGPGYGLDWNSAEATDLNERSAILNAYHLPGVPLEGLYPSITPVNSFRLIFDAYFQTSLGLLPDRSMYSTWGQPYKFFPID